jgi:hypothetical protein
MRTIFLTFLTLVILYSGFIEAVPPARDSVTVSQEALNRQTVERYRYRIKAAIVIVGSSLAARFAAASDSPCVYDLSIAGGSALTGLSVVAQKQDKPRLVLVEINLLDRPIDTRFAETPLWYRRYLRFTWVENSPVSRLLTAIANARGSRSEIKSNAAMRAEPLRLQQASYDHPPSATAMAQSIKALRQTINVLRQQGIATALFEMPVDASLENRPRSRMMREAVKAAFPEMRFIDAQTLSAGASVQTADGIHLEKEEAALVLHRLLAAFGSVCPNNTAPVMEIRR